MVQRFFLNICVLFLIPLYSSAQLNADCKSAMVLDDMALLVKSVHGPGEILEIKGHELGNDKFFTQEHNTVWINYQPKASGKLSFDIIPDIPTEDWDFMIFKAGKDQCQEIIDQKLIPVRSNLARNDEKLGGKTGLKPDAKSEFEPAGPNPNYCRPLDVVKDGQYLIIIDINQKSEKGFGLKCSFEAKLEEITSEHNLDPISSSSFEFADMTDEAPVSNKLKIKFQVFLEETKKPIACNAEVVGVQWNAEEAKFDNKSEFEVEVPKEKWFYVNVSKDGYTFSSEKYKATSELVDFPQKIYVSKVKAGEHIVMKEIVFRENTTQLLPTSINALQQLISFMKEHPNARIKIKGHVNAPEMDNDGKVKKISLKRAEQIKQFLVDSDIDGKRIEVEGMGNEFMIFPSPSTYEEEKANRRVEIEILSL